MGVQLDGCVLAGRLSLFYILFIRLILGCHECSTVLVAHLSLE